MPLPATLDTIRRVTSVVDNPSILRGWLSAWRRLHCIARSAWAGDKDPFLVAIHSGLRLSLGPPSPRHGCRKSLLRRALVAAARDHKWVVGAFAVIAYTFGLRSPSELVRQAQGHLFSAKVSIIYFGPITRKGQALSQTLSRWCVCKQDRLLCVHDWLSVLVTLRPHGKMFTESTSALMQEFTKTLLAWTLRLPEPTPAIAFVAGSCWKFMVSPQCCVLGSGRHLQLHRPMLPTMSRQPRHLEQLCWMSQMTTLEIVTVSLSTGSDPFFNLSLLFLHWLPFGRSHSIALILMPMFKKTVHFHTAE